MALMSPGNCPWPGVIGTTAMRVGLSAPWVISMDSPAWAGMAAAPNINVASNVCVASNVSVSSTVADLNVADRNIPR